MEKTSVSQNILFWTLVILLQMNTFPLVQIFSSLDQAWVNPQRPAPAFEFSQQHRSGNSPVHSDFQNPKKPRNQSHTWLEVGCTQWQTGSAVRRAVEYNQWLRKFCQYLATQTCIFFGIQLHIRPCLFTKRGLFWRVIYTNWNITQISRKETNQVFALG